MDVSITCVAKSFQKFSLEVYCLRAGQKWECEVVDGERIGSWNEETRGLHHSHLRGRSFVVSFVTTVAGHNFVHFRQLLLDRGSSEGKIHKSLGLGELCVRFLVERMEFESSWQPYRLR